MFEAESKRGIVAKAPYSLYIMLADPRNIYNMVPEDRRKDFQVDYDSVHGTVQGFNIGIRYLERRPYSLLKLQDDGAPFHFTVSLHFDPAETEFETEFYIRVEADLNFMMKTLLGGRIKEALDKIVDSLVDVSNGRMPEGFDPSSMPQDFSPFK